jgi:hypothetical protein
MGVVLLILAVTGGQSLAVWNKARAARITYLFYASIQLNLASSLTVMAFNFDEIELNSLIYATLFAKGIDTRSGDVKLFAVRGEHAPH